MAKTAPAGLGAQGRKLWKGITDVYELRADELRVLEDACREVDLIERVQKELDRPGTKLVVNGSMGQPVANPLVQEIRQHRATVKALVASLKLPDEPAEGSASGNRSASARAAAAARWKRGA